MISIKNKGNFNKTEKFFRGVINSEFVGILEKYGQLGVNNLSISTPMDSGKTANSWRYEIRHYAGGVSISWTNSNVVNGVPIAILLQYGHATSNGGYVQGSDYINPALRPVFDKMANDVWKEVTK